MELTNIDYSRVLQPQEDGYDVAFFMALKRERGFVERDISHMPRTLGGRVYIESWRPEQPGKEFVSPDSRSFDILERDASEAAPVLYRCVTHLVDVFTAIECYNGIEYSIQHAAVEYPGAWIIQAPITEGPAVALRSLMHELLHWKLTALGFGDGPNSFEETTGEFILNGRHELHHSIVNSYADTMQTYMRAPVGRPMSACIHGYASFLADATAAVKFAKYDVRRFARCVRYAKIWTDRLDVSLQAILDGARTTSKGEALLRGLKNWTDEYKREYAEVKSEWDRLIDLDAA